MATRLLAVDPGGAHVGLAVFNGLACADAWEVTPAEGLTVIKGLLLQEALDVLVYEKYVLYAQLAAAQAGSEMETAEMIGAIKYMWAEWGEQCQLVGQMASIQKPTQSILRAKGIVSEAKRRKAGPHALSAELHGWYYALRQSPGRRKVTTRQTP